MSAPAVTTDTENANEQNDRTSSIKVNNVSFIESVGTIHTSFPAGGTVLVTQIQKIRQSIEKLGKICFMQGMQSGDLLIIATGYTVSMTLQRSIDSVMKEKTDAVRARGLLLF